MELLIAERDAQHKLVVDGFLQYCENLGVYVQHPRFNSYHWGVVFTCAIRITPVTINHINGQLTASFDKKRRSVSQLKGWVNKSGWHGKQLYEKIDLLRGRSVGYVGIEKTKHKLAGFVRFDKPRQSIAKIPIFDYDSIAIIRSFLLGHTQDGIVIDRLLEKVPEFNEAYTEARRKKVDEKTP